MPIKQPIAEILRIAIHDSGLRFLTSEQKSGVLRQSLLPFARGEAGINLDTADKLTNYFGLELRPATHKTATRTTPKRKEK